MVGVASDHIASMAPGADEIRPRVFWIAFWLVAVVANTELARSIAADVRQRGEFAVAGGHKLTALRSLTEPATPGQRPRCG